MACKQLGVKVWPHDERGQSVSLFVTLVSAALIIVLGLVVDGGQQVRAARSCETAAAAAARAGADAVSKDVLSGERGDSSAALRAAQLSLASQPDVSGTATLGPGDRSVRVRTSATHSTYFLSLIGIDSVSATGSAQAELVVVG